MLLLALLLATPGRSQVATYPYLEDFETFGTGTPGTMQHGWSQGGGDQFDWSVHTGATPSTGTGPTGDHTTGSGVYLFTEASSPRLEGDEALLVSPTFDLTSLACPVVSFHYHMYGATMGTLEVAVDGGAGPVPIWSRQGPQQQSAGEPYRWSGPISLQGHGGIVSLQFLGRRGSSYTGDIAIDDVEVFDLTGIDVGVRSMDTPVTGCGLGGAEVVTVTIANNSCTTASGVQVQCAVTGPIGSTVPAELVALPIAPGGTVAHTFATPVDLSIEGSYTITAWTLLAGDVAPDNDTGSTVVDHLAGVGLFPHLEDFESFSTGTPGGLTGGWQQVGGDDFDWTVDRNGTSSDTGPAVDHTLGTSAGIYLYAEASTPRVPGDEAHLVSPCLGTGAMSAPAVSFWYHMYGADMGTLHLDVLSAGMWIEDIWSLSGPQQTTNSDPWRSSGPIFLAPYGASVVLRFRAERGTNTKSDMAIDDVLVFDADTPDVAVLALTAPVSTCLGATESVRVVLENRNLISGATGFPIRYAVSGPASAAPPPELVGVAIPPSSTAEVTFAAPADLSLPGTYLFTVTAMLPGDASPGNDTLVWPVVVPAGQHGAFPYQEDLESFTVGAPGGLAGGWQQELTADQFDWTVHSGDTPSLSGPAADHTLGTPAGIYLYTETSHPVGPFEEAHLLSPCLDTGSLVSPVLRFWYHMYGADMGTLHLDVASGGTWITDLWVATGALQASPQDPWAWSGPIDLGSLTSPLRLRFRGENGVGVTSDMAIDDIQVLDGALPDVGVVAVDAPRSDCGLGLEVITVTLANHGTVNAAAAVPVSFTVTGPVAGSSPVETAPLSILPLSSGSFSFATLADLSVPGTYTIQARTQLPGDVDPANDAVTAVVTHHPRIVAYPYLEDFEGGAGGWREGGVASSWELGSPGGAVISTAAPGGVTSWVTGLTGLYHPAEQSQVLSPCFDTTGLLDPWIGLDVWWNSEFGWDGAALQYSTDDGLSWLTLGEYGDPGSWYTDDSIDGRPGGMRQGWTGRAATGDGSGGWVEASHSLTGLGGLASLRLRVAFGSDGFVQDEGFGFDNVRIGDGPPGAGCQVGLCGDCNEDGLLSILDALRAAQADVGLVTLSPLQFSSCNVAGLLEPDPGARVTVLDALAIAQAVTGLPITLTCCT